MKHKIGAYSAFFAAICNIAASALFVYALDKRHVYEADSTATTARTLGSWLFMISIALWLAFILSRFSLKQK